MPLLLEVEASEVSNFVDEGLSNAVNFISELNRVYTVNAIILRWNSTRLVRNSMHFAVLIHKQNDYVLQNFRRNCLQIA